MHIQQYCWENGRGWDTAPCAGDVREADLILVFGNTAVLRETDCIQHLQQTFPSARMLGCSTAGEIYGTTVSDNRIIATCISFDKTTIQTHFVKVSDYNNTVVATKALIEQFPKDNLCHIMLFSDGVLTNGSDIIRGITEAFPPNFPITGGLAGDGLDFEQSYVIFDGEIHQSTIGAVGFYGSSLKIGYGSAGGWIPFGPERLITRSRGNVLFELDGQSAFELYRQYLGNPQGSLPATGIHFPLSVKLEEGEEPIVRTMLFVDEKNRTLGFAGDVPTGCYARFMRAMPDDLIDGAARAATIARRTGGDNPELCIAISCIGRRAVLKQLTEEETESIEEVYQRPLVMTGFYSYGEIAPFSPGDRVILHNQTMTITTISEE